MRCHGLRVYMSAAELERFAERWPCYDGPRRGGWAEFDRSGDLVDLSPGWIKHDGAALSAIVEDCRAFQIKRKGVTS
jgi:hypothetical protein